MLHLGLLCHSAEEAELPFFRPSPAPTMLDRTFTHLGSSSHVLMIGETDMGAAMQQHAVQCATHALNLHKASSDVLQQTARSLKQEFDKCYGDGWQCVVGTNFGSFVTHSHGNFIYFCIDKLAFLLFKGSPACCLHHH